MKRMFRKKQKGIFERVGEEWGDYDRMMIEKVRPLNGRKIIPKEMDILALVSK